MDLTYKDTVEITKSVTELVVQNKLLSLHQDPENAAKEIAQFCNTFVEELTKPKVD